MRATMLGLLALVALLASGCASDGGGAKVASVNLDYDGAGSGDHEEQLTCDPDGQVTGSGNVEDGRLQILVKDGEGNTVYDETYTDGDFDFDSESVDGNEGRWTLRAERMPNDLVGDDFRGSYSFTLTC